MYGLRMSAMTTKTEINLPPLPVAGEAMSRWAYDESEMQEYARAAVEADRQRRGEPVEPTMPPLTDAMRAVLRNEHCVYDSEDALYAALCDAAQAQRHEFDDCTASPTGKHSESWFANGDCEYCKAGAQPNAPLFWAQAQSSGISGELAEQSGNSGELDRKQDL